MILSSDISIIQTCQNKIIFQANGEFLIRGSKYAR
jgi:hypothetical protein